ncbi:GNAT family N-acetyltransferase [Rothia terrae]|uniref:GNAT family N-acetyltransferase n=1 Tax=Rothia terrae TaxID=396015 RepID=UPI0014451255|nr:GNAT family N-acetyltransferase [Rothia terrae]NKZ34946.1 GNAT family N-acetyltransferase [Rothia terrae]
MMHNLSFSSLTCKHLSQIQELLESNADYTHRISGQNVSPHAASGIFETLPAGASPEDLLVIGAWQDTQLVGLCVTVTHWPTPATAYIGLLATHRDYQGQGIGRQLHSYLLERLQLHTAIKTLRLGIVATNAASATPFWESLGYTFTGETKPHQAGRVTSTVELFELRIDYRQHVRREVQEFWDTARTVLPSLPMTAPDAWSFGSTAKQADDLLALVLSETKTATSSALHDYAAENEPLPVAGQYSVLCNGTGTPRAIIQITSVTVTEFWQVSTDHAQAEGEGDRTLDSWRANHRQYWEANSPDGFYPHMQVVCERFALIYPQAAR